MTLAKKNCHASNMMQDLIGYKQLTGLLRPQKLSEL